ncbi:MAG TPA: hypothetical protein VIZ43_04075 [Trebonia sp.]
MNEVNERPRTTRIAAVRALHRGRLVIWNPRYQLDPPGTPPGAPQRNGHARDFLTRPFPVGDLLLKAPHAARPSGEGR